MVHVGNITHQINGKFEILKGKLGALNSLYVRGPGKGGSTLSILYIALLGISATVKNESETTILIV